MPNEDNKPLLSGKQVTPLKTTNDYDRSDATYGYNFTTLPSLSESKVNEYQNYLGTENIPLDEAVLQEAAFQSQGRLGNLAKGTFRALGKAVTEALAIPGYVAAPFTGFDNAWIEGVNSLDEGIKSALPIYVSKDIQEGGIGEKLMSSSWWGTTGADGAGFMLGMLAGNAYARGATGLGKMAAKGLGIETKGIEASEALANVEKIIAEGNGLSKSARTFNPLKTAFNPFGKTMAESTATVVINTMAEAGAEANNTYRNLLSELTTSGMDAEEAKKLAGDAAMNVYGLNLAVLLLSNSLMEKYLFRRFSVQAKPNVKLLANLFEDGGKGATRSAYNKAFQFGKTALGGTLSEGFWEEGMQTAIQQVAEQNAKDGDASLWNVISNVLPKYYEDLTALEETADSKEFYEGVVLGGLLSLPFGVAGTNQTLKNEKAYLEGEAAFTPNAFQKNVLRMRERKASAGLIEVLKANMQLNTMKVEDIAVMEDGKPKFVNGELQYDPEKLASLSVAVLDMAKDKVETDAIKTLIEQGEKSTKNDVLLKLMQHKQDVQLLGKYAAIKDGDKVFETHVDYYLNKWKDAQISSGKQVTEQELIDKRTELINKVKVMSGIFEQVNETNDATTKEYKDKPIFRELIRNRKIDTALQIDFFSNEVRKLSENFVDDIESFLNTAGPKNKENTTYNKLEEDKITLLKEKQKFYQTQLEKATEEYTKLYTKEGMKEIADYLDKKDEEIKTPTPVKEKEKTIAEILTEKGVKKGDTVHINTKGYGYYVSADPKNEGKYFIKTKEGNQAKWVISSNGDMVNKPTSVDATTMTGFMEKNKEYIVSPQEMRDMEIAKQAKENEEAEKKKINDYRKVLDNYISKTQDVLNNVQKDIENLENSEKISTEEEESKLEELNLNRLRVDKFINKTLASIRSLRKIAISINSAYATENVFENGDLQKSLNEAYSEFEEIESDIRELKKQIEVKKQQIEERKTILEKLKETKQVHENTINVLEQIKSNLDSKDTNQQLEEYLNNVWEPLFDFFQSDVKAVRNNKDSFLKLLGNNITEFRKNIATQIESIDKVLATQEAKLDEALESIGNIERNIENMENVLAKVKSEYDKLKKDYDDLLAKVKEQEDKIPNSLKTKQTEKDLKVYASKLANLYAKSGKLEANITTAKQKLSEFKEIADVLERYMKRKEILSNIETKEFMDSLKDYFKTRNIFNKLITEYTIKASEKVPDATIEDSSEPKPISTKRPTTPYFTTGQEVRMITKNGVMIDERVDGKLQFSNSKTQRLWGDFTRSLKDTDLPNYKLMYFNGSLKSKYPKLWEQLVEELKDAGLPETTEGIWQVVTNANGEPILREGKYLFMGMSLPTKVEERMGENYTEEIGKEYRDTYNSIMDLLAKGETIYSNIVGTTKGFANLEYDENGKPLEYKIGEVLPQYKNSVPPIYVGRITDKRDRELNMPIGRPYVKDFIHGRTYLLNQRKLNPSEIETVLYLYSQLSGNFAARWNNMQIVPKNTNEISVIQMFINHGNDWKNGKFQNGSRIYVADGKLVWSTGEANVGGTIELSELIKYFNGEPVNMDKINLVKEFLSEKLLYYNEKLKGASFAIPRYDKATKTLVVDKQIGSGEYVKHMVNTVFSMNVNPKKPVVQVNLEYSKPVTTPKVEAKVVTKEEGINFEKDKEGNVISNQVNSNKLIKFYESVLAKAKENNVDISKEIKSFETMDFGGLQDAYDYLVNLLNTKILKSNENKPIKVATLDIVRGKTTMVKDIEKQQDEQLENPDFVSDAPLSDFGFEPVVPETKEEKPVDKQVGESDADKIARLKAKKDKNQTPIESISIIESIQPEKKWDEGIPFKIITRNEARDILTTMVDSNTITRECE